MMASLNENCIISKTVSLKIIVTPSSPKYFRVERLKKYSFILFHHFFWKRTFFEGVPVLAFLVPKVYLGVNYMWKKVSEGLLAFWQFGFFWLLFHICFLAMMHLFNSKNHLVIKLDDQVIWHQWFFFVINKSGKNSSGGKNRIFPMDARENCTYRF